MEQNNSSNFENLRLSKLSIDSFAFFLEDKRIADIMPTFRQYLSPSMKLNAETMSKVFEGITPVGMVDRDTAEDFEKRIRAVKGQQI